MTNRPISILPLLAVLATCGPQVAPGPEGPYLGQTPPGDTAELFAPGWVGTGLYTRDVAMTPDGSELYFGVMVAGLAVIMETHLEDGHWTRPEVAPFSGDPRVLDLEPHITPTGDRFLFLSTRPRQGRPEDAIGTWTAQDIWVMDREGDGWGEPYNPGPPVNTDGPEFFPSVTRDGTLYFTRGDATASAIYRAPAVDDGWGEPERLPASVNSTPSQFNAFIDPDESYILFSTGGRDDTRGGADYYVCFRSGDGWTEPINLGDRVNTPSGTEFSPFVSRDGRYLFFMAARGRGLGTLPDTLEAETLRALHDRPGANGAAIYWIDARFIEALRPD